MSSGGAERLKVIEGDTQVAPDVDPLVGKTIDGRYRVEGVLGEGGMGLVYRATHIVLGKPLAIKVLRPDVTRDDEILTRFRQEAQSASGIGHEHIIDISDFGALPDGSTYFVMEYLDGTDLGGLLEKVRPVPASRAVHIAKQICQALGAAHERGIVHRDLKPDNVFLIRRGGDPDFVKVLDFGIAKVGGTSSKLTRAGQVFGTPHYMSPEQCSGTGVDHRTDIYALGVILYEMLTGDPPFDADNLMGILTKHLYEEPVPPTQRAAPGTVPEGLEAIVLRCLAKRADARYESMAELAADLEQLEAGLVPRAARPEATWRTVLPSRTETVEPARRSKMPIVLGAVAALIGIAGGVAALMVPGRSADAEPVVAEIAPPPEPVEAPSEEKPEVEAPEPVLPPPVVRVTVQSEPPGAEVWLGEELIGNSPVQIPRPNTGEKIEVELRLAGYKSQPVRISSLTAENVRVSLEKEAEPERSSSRRSGSRRGQAAAATPSSPTPEPEEARRPPRRGSALPQSEVLDPWAND